jgi:hypothetical protein
MPMPLKSIFIPLLYFLGRLPRFVANPHPGHSQKPGLQPPRRPHRRIRLLYGGRGIDPQFEFAPIVAHNFFPCKVMSASPIQLSKMEKLQQKSVFQMIHAGYLPPITAI